MRIALSGLWVALMLTHLLGDASQATSRLHDNFLIAVGFVFNALIVWCALTWTAV